MSGGDRRRFVVFSDLHYGGVWLPKDAEARAARFIESIPAGTVVIVAGDALELELYPIHAIPPTAETLAGNSAPPSPVLDAIRSLASRTRVIFVPGNHDCELAMEGCKSPIEGAEVWNSTEPFVVRDEETGEPLLAVAHGNNSDSTCVERHFTAAAGDFHQSLNYFLARLGMSAKTASEGVNMEPLPLATVMGMFVDAVSNKVPSDVAFGIAARSPAPMVAFMKLLVDLFEKQTVGELPDDQVVHCGAQGTCTVAEMRRFLEESSAWLVDKADPSFDDGLRSAAAGTAAGGTAAAVWSVVKKFVTETCSQLAVPYAKHVAKSTGAPVVCLGHTHIPHIEVLQADDGRKFVYVNDGALCYGNADVSFAEVVLGREVTLVVGNKRRTLPWPCAD